MKAKILLLALLVLGSSLAQAQWSLTGNANATSTSFLGTTAANPSTGQDLVFKRAGVFAGLLSSSKTSFGVNSVAMPNSISLGINAGQFSSGLGQNIYIGTNAGRGFNASNLNSGVGNLFIGHDSGLMNKTGNGNIFLGQSSGLNLTNGLNNILIGNSAGINSTTGSDNIYIGNYTGCEDDSTVNNSIFIGNQSGFTQCTSNTLVIDQGENDNPLIWGDFAADRLKFHGKVGIGGNTATAFGNFPTTSGGVNVSAYNLFVKGGILTDEVRVSTTWADYVFAKDYDLPTLQEVEKHIQEKGHLINVPSAQQVENNGIELGEMAKIQQEKIEELTLYIIEQNKINEAQNKVISELSARLNAIEKR